MVLDAYAGFRAQLYAYAAVELGDPQATLPAVLKVIDEEHPPLRVLLGTEGRPVARAAFAERLALWEAWGPFRTPPKASLESGFSIPRLADAGCWEWDISEPCRPGEHQRL